MIDIDAELLRAFDDQGSLLTARAGEVLLEAGSPGGDLHLLEVGLLEVRAMEDRTPVVRTLGPPDLLGDLSVLTGGPRTASVIARTDVRLRHLSAEVVRERLSDPAFALALGRSAAGRLAGGAVQEDVHLDGWLDLEGRAGEILEHLRARDGRRWVLPGDVDAALGAGHADAASGPEAEATAAWLAERVLEGPVVLASRGPASAVWVARVRRHAQGLVEFTDGPVDAHPGRHALVRSRASGGVGPDGAQLYVLGADDLPADLEAFLEGQLPGSVQALADLPRRARLAIEAAAERVVVPSGEAFCRQGEPSDTLAWVLEGRFDIAREGRHLGRIGPGDVLGEVSYLTGAVRGADVVAARDSVLAVVSFGVLNRLARLHPSIARVMGANAARRLAGPPPRPPVRSLVLLPLPGCEEQADALARAIGRCAGARRLDVARAARELGVEPQAVREGGALEPWLRAWFARSDRLAERTVCVGSLAADDWTARCLRQADEVVLVGQGSEPALHPALEGRAADALALWWPDGTIHGTAHWLEQHPDAAWMHLLPEPASFDRAARRLTGMAVGLALAGASSRGIAHLGVARALGALGWPVDRLAGSSSGGQVAALLATLLGEEHAVRASLRILQGFDARLRRWNPPFTALLSGAQVERLVREAFGDLCIEDLPVSVQLTGTDLNRGELVVMDRGPLWEAVRVTTSLPVIWPPVSRDGQVLVDGGIMNNAPADRMPDCAQVVLSEVIPAGSERFPGVEPYGTQLSGWRLLQDRLTGTSAEVPSLLGVLMESMMMANIAQRRRLEGMPGLVPLTIGIPDLGFFGLRSEEQAAELIELAASIATEHLEPWTGHPEAGRNPLVQEDTPGEC